MNILDHIKAGHYPADIKGRPLVPMRDGEVATIYATDFPGRHQEPIAGHDGTEVQTWAADGRYWSQRPGARDLMPPDALRASLAERSGA